MDTQALFTYFLSRITMIVVILMGTLMAVYFGLLISEGNVLTPYFIIVCGICLVAGIALGRRIWMLLPLALVFAGAPAIPLGARSIDLFDFTVMVVFVFFLTRVAFGRQKLLILNLQSLAILGFVVWVYFVYTNNPVGLVFMGSSMGGAKSYLKIIVSFLAYVIMVNQEISEKETKWMITISITGAILGLVYLLIGLFFPGDVNEGDPDSINTWEASLAPPALLLMVYLYSRYNFKQIFSLNRPWVLPSILAAYPLVLYSGKRALLGGAVMVGLATSLLRKNTLLFFVILVLSASVITLLVVGHGTLFELPPTAQRSLMNFPGNWTSGSWL